MSQNDKEAEIIIGGVKLSHSQSLTLRVAIGSFMIQLSDLEYRKALGQIAVNYENRLNEIMKLIIDSIRKP